MSEKSSALAIACPLCGGDLQFDPTVGKLVCEYCGHETTPEEAQARYEKDKDKIKDQKSDDWGEDSDDMKAFGCSACGAEMIAEENTAAMICPFCGNSTIVPSQFEGSVRPDCLIPFAFTKEQAISKYKSFYSGKKLLPKSFAENNHVEDIQGVYVPFLLFSGKSDISARYKSESKKDKGEEIEISVYDSVRQGSVLFENVPTDASERMPDDLMDSIEPYDMNKLADFNISYLPGFLAERSNVDEASEKDRATKRVDTSIREMTRNTIKYEIKERNENVSVNITDQRYALLPVWYLVTKWDDKTWKFAMNGQTGKFIGDLPVDGGKLAGLVIISFIIAAVILYLILGDMASTIFGAVIAAAISGFIGYSSMKPVANARDAGKYMKDLRLDVRTDDLIGTRREKKQK